MNSRIFLGRSGFERSALSKFCFSGLMLLGAASADVQARGILASAQISGVQLGKAQYAYTLTLENTAASSASIGLFWFAWAAGQADFLSSEPTSIQTPAAWNATVEGGGQGDGYSIQFNTFTTPLAPGSSLTFTFHSSDSPKIMGGPAVFYPEYPTLMSQVYSSYDADGLQELFVATLVPTNVPTNLTIALSGQQMVLAWPTNAGYYSLQTTTNLASRARWTAVTNIPTVNGSSNAVTVPFTNTRQFFRLQSE
jgi:hypothetical protein